MARRMRAGAPYIMRTNKRRNLTSGQWAAVAVEQEELVREIAAGVERERLEKQSQNAVNRHTKENVLASGNLLPEARTAPTRTSEKVASIIFFNQDFIYAKKWIPSGGFQATKPPHDHHAKNADSLSLARQHVENTENKWFRESTLC